MECVNKKIVLLSSGDVNGAYEAMYRVAILLKELGCEVKMIVKHKTKPDDFIINYKPKKKSFIKRKVIKLFSKISKIKLDNNYLFLSSDENTTNIDAKKMIKQIGFVPDYIFTGMTINFMNTTDVLRLQQKTKAQVYNITVDMNHFTGGCHFAWDCKGYENGCNVFCPAIIKGNKKIAQQNFETKLSNARKGKFKILTGSGWTLLQAKKSKIYKNQSVFFNINSLINTQLFNAKNRGIAKQIFGLNNDTFYILMGCQNSNDKRKGFDYLLDALHIFAKENHYKKVELLVVSKVKSSRFDEITKIEKKYIDYINDYRLLSLLYQSVDVFINSSIEDSGPMMVSEALACGTPVVGFDMGVVNNMVVTGYNGYKAKLKDSNDLAKGITTIYNLSNKEYKEYSKNAVKQVEEFSSFEYAKKIFKKIII